MHQQQTNTPRPSLQPLVRESIRQLERVSARFYNPRRENRQEWRPAIVSQYLREWEEYWRGAQVETNGGGKPCSLSCRILLIRVIDAQPRRRSEP
jgi:hypothetical protein